MLLGLLGIHIIRREDMWKHNIYSISTRFSDPLLNLWLYESIRIQTVRNDTENTTLPSLLNSSFKKTFVSFYRNEKYFLFIIALRDYRLHFLRVTAPMYSKWKHISLQCIVYSSFIIRIFKYIINCNRFIKSFSFTKM